MSAFVNPFVSGKHRRIVAFAIWLVMTLALLAAGAWFWSLQIQQSLRSEAKESLAQFDTLHSNVTSAFAELQAAASAEPCSEPFLHELRRIAFRPDGLNEFMYAPGGVVVCSTGIASASAGISLGTPDISPSENGLAYWVNKNLDALGLAGVTGNIVLQEPFALVVPPLSSWAASQSSWAKKEFVLALPDGRVWHLGGEDGIHVAATASPASATPASALHALTCGERHPYCVAAAADVTEIALGSPVEVLIAIGVIAFYAVWPASVAHRALYRFWSLEHRFLRNLNTGSIVCAYQPIVDLRTGRISGCEVLARWRDVDGSIVSPEKFIEIVASSGRTLVFTKMVAERAFDELSRSLPRDIRMQINFNIFPRDLDSEKLAETFRVFQSERERFPLALEIVETDALALDNAELEIEALARRGIRTYIDDFGNGYSSIHRVASLAIHGVKLDRSFAMAPSESLMARMLVHALDMIASSEREIVVEGVETQDRLDLLAGTNRVSYVQGYLISRPLPIERFAEFVEAHNAGGASARKPMAAA